MIRGWCWLEKAGARPRFHRRQNDWDGSHWTTETGAKISGGGQLDGVTCISSTVCVAVGGFTYNAGTFIERRS